MFATPSWGERGDFYPDILLYAENGTERGEALDEDGAIINGQPKSPVHGVEHFKPDSAGTVSKLGYLHRDCFGASTHLPSTFWLGRACQETHLSVALAAVGKPAILHLQPI